MDTVTVGRAFCGFRKSDDRLFVGVVESVKDTPKGRRVVIHSAGPNGKTEYKTFYMENMQHYSCIVTEYWPEGMTHRQMLESVGAA